MYHFPLHTIPFPSTPRQRCLQIAIIPPSFSHLCLDMFQKTGSFHLPSRCEEICSLMAFKTGSADNKKKEKWEEERFAPPVSHPPPNTSRRILCGAERCGGCRAKVPTVPVTLTSICRQLDTISSTAAYSHWMGSLSHSRVWMPFKAQARNCVSSLCAIVFFVHSCCFKKNPLLLNWIPERLYWRNAQRNILLPMFKSFL